MSHQWSTEQGKYQVYRVPYRKLGDFYHTNKLVGQIEIPGH